MHNTCEPPGDVLGRQAEPIWRQWLEDQGIKLEPKADATRPGPDAVWDQTGGGTDPGWNFAELKRNNSAGISSGKAQVAGRFDQGYQGPGALYLWDYDAATGQFSFNLYASFSE